jgi:hypothetical protein
MDMVIRVSLNSSPAPDWARYLAVLDTYDGAEDAAPFDRCIGLAAHPLEAVCELLLSLDMFGYERPT